MPSAYLAGLILAFSALTAPAAGAAGGPNAIFLVAKPDLNDPNFRESVVLVTLPPRGGPFGVIINRPLGERLSDVFPDQALLKDRKEVLYAGGPVARQGLVFLVRSSSPPPGALMVLPGVFFTADIDLLEALFQRKDPLLGLRIFAGYSGWAPGQLQNEIVRGGWLVAPADAATVFDKDPSRVWRELLDRAATKQALKDEGPSTLLRTGGGMGDEETPPRATSVSHHPSPVTHHVFSGGGARR